MSFEPDVIIIKKELDRNIPSLEGGTYSEDLDTVRVSEYLLEVSKYDTFKFDDLELVICKPEFTSFNSLVRDKLKELGITYQISN